MFFKKLFPLAFALTFATLAAATFEEEFAAIEKTDFKRDLVLRTELVRGGKPAAVIAAPAGLAECAKIVADAVFAKTGVRLPVQDKLSPDMHAIVLGNRDDNPASADLYCRYYSLLDAKYPGRGGAVARSVHDPFGSRKNILIAGGSDLAGHRRAAELLAKRIAAEPAGKDLSLGWFADLEYPANLRIPASAKDAKIWQTAWDKTYPGFGWNQISRNLALFYLTNDPKFAREFLRLAFPDKQAQKDSLAADGPFAVGSLKNPLGEPYHYNGTQIMLYWDLVEDNPFFDDATRQKVTAKLCEALLRRKYFGDKGIFRLFRYQDGVPAKLENRHWIAEALLVYTFARYFDKHYRLPLATDSLKHSQKFFVTLDKYPAVTAGTPHWYGSFILPAFHYALLSGGTRYAGSPVMRTYVRNLLMLCDRQPNDWALSCCSRQFLNVMAYLAQDQAPADLAESISLPEDELLLGQSFVSEQPYPENFFRDGDGKWQTASFDPRGMAKEWDPPFDPHEVAEWLSCGKQGDEKHGVDFVLCDTKFESGRSPFHNCAVIELILNGTPVLRGYCNQPLFYPDARGSGKLAKYTRVLRRGRTQNTSFLQGEVADFNGGVWRRTFLLRDHAFLLTVDDFTPEKAVKTIDADSFFQFPAGARFSAGPGGFELRAPDKTRWTIDCSEPAELRRVKMSQGLLKSEAETAVFALRSPDKIRMVTILRPGAPGKLASAARQGDGVALRLPETAMLRFSGDGFILREKTKVFAFACREVPGVFTSSAPVAAEWDGKTLSLSADAPAKVTLNDGRTVPLAANETAAVPFAGKITVPDENAVQALLAAKKPVVTPQPDAPQLAEKWRLAPGKPVGAFEVIDFAGEKLLAAACGKKLVVVDPAGKTRLALEVPSPIGAFAWFPEKKLFLIGSLDERLRAVTPDGKVVWDFTSRNSDEAQYQGMWWSKGEIPGVRGVTVARLAGGKTYIVVGSASVVEVLSPEGKLLSRRFAPWGTFKKCTVLPDRFLCWGYMVSHPVVFSYDAKLKRSDLVIDKDKNGVWMGGFGFGFNGRSALEYARLAPNEPPRLVGTFNGTMNRILVWDTKGKVLHETDLGFGLRAFGAPFGTPVLRATNLRGFALPDFDGNGNRSIAAGSVRRYVAAFDKDLNRRFLTRLPAEPRDVAAVPGPQGDRIAVSCDDGNVYLLDGAGKILAQCRVAPKPTLLAALGKTLFVGSETGELAAFELP